MKSPILGGSYRSRSPNLADQVVINLYPEIVETKTGKEVGGLYGCPGLVNIATVDGGPIRALKAVGSTLYAVSGANAYAINTSYSATLLGPVGNDGLPASIINNPNQIGIASAGRFYALSGGAFGPVALPFAGCGMATYQDGFGVLTQPGTVNLWQSNLNDLTTWDPLNYDTADGQPDNIVAIIDLHRQIIVLKQQYAEVWINAGNNGFVFQRIEGVYLNAGCIAPYSVAELGQSVLWLGQNKQGGNRVFLLSGYEPHDMSTHATSYAWAQYPTTADAIGFTYQQEKHEFYVLTFPSGGETWVLDLTVSKALGVPMWHQRAGFSGGLFTRYAAQCSAFFNGQLVFGDAFSGNLYRPDLGVYTDNGQPRKWLRTWPAHQQGATKSVPYRCLEIDAESGIGAPPAGTSQVMLRYSDDAHNWSNPRAQSNGALGQTSARLKYLRLGIERRGSGNYRIFELSSTDPFAVALIGADIS
jgi:hypothetical protein